VLTEQHAAVVAPPLGVTSIRKDHALDVGHVKPADPALPVKQPKKTTAVSTMVASLGHWERSESDDDDGLSSKQRSKNMASRSNPSSLLPLGAKPSPKSQVTAQVRPMFNPPQVSAASAPISVPPPRRHYLEDMDDDDDDDHFV
jgi:hypothetical protein